MPYPRTSGLPTPDYASAAHSERLRELITDRIRQSGGSVSFAEFMQLALYEPGAGYYSAGATKLGAAGDFVTAPEISSVFGRVIARQCAEVLRQVGNGSILEFGAGSGKLAVDILTALDSLGALPAHYRILEISPDLQRRQRRRLQSELPQFTGRIEWLDRLPDAHRGVVIANEVLDAMPVERFRRRDQLVEQQRVAAHDGGFRFVYSPAPPALRRAVHRIEDDLGHRLPPSYVSEVSMAAAGWISDIGSLLERGLALIFDYGVSRREYYAGDRTDGWLRCHFRQHAHSDPLILVGIQDITAWVDFSAIAEAAVACGLSVAGYAPQSLFLAAGGLQQELRALAELDVEQQLAMSAQIKTLTLPGEMGENVKCIGLERGPLEPLTAFALSDRTHTL